MAVAEHKVFPTFSPIDTFLSSVCCLVTLHFTYSISARLYPYARRYVVFFFFFPFVREGLGVGGIISSGAA